MYSSQRDSMIVARHEVPGKASPEGPSRRVRYDRAANSGGLPRKKRVAAFRYDGPFPEHIDFFCFYIQNFVIPILQSPNRKAHTCKDQTVPYGTALLGWRF